jgi:tetratricopeptide (TPR) repeat protein
MKEINKKNWHIAFLQIAYFRAILQAGRQMETASFLNDSGIALTEANRPNEAIPLFREALSMEPENPLLWFNLGIAQQHTGGYEEAIDSFYRAIVIDDGFADAWVSMGLIYYELNEYELAEECYHAALMRTGDDPKTWNNLGVLYFNGGNLEEARLSFEEAVSLSPHYPDALFNLRDVCRELGDYRAAAEFERALSGLKNARSPVIKPGVFE